MADEAIPRWWVKEGEEEGVNLSGQYHRFVPMEEGVHQVHDDSFGLDASGEGVGDSMLGCYFLQMSDVLCTARTLKCSCLSSRCTTSKG